MRRITGNRDKLNVFGYKKRCRRLSQYSDMWVLVYCWCERGMRHTARSVRQATPPGSRAHPPIVDVDAPTVCVPIRFRGYSIKTDAWEFLHTKSLIASTLAATSGAPRSSARGRNSPRSSITSDLLYMMPHFISFTSANASGR